MAASPASSRTRNAIARRAAKAFGRVGRTTEKRSQQPCPLTLNSSRLSLKKPTMAARQCRATVSSSAAEDRSTELIRLLEQDIRRARQMSHPHTSELARNIRECVEDAILRPCSQSVTLHHCRHHFALRATVRLGARGQDANIRSWSGQQDSNLRPEVPETSALPDCAMPRCRSV